MGKLFIAILLFGLAIVMFKFNANKKKEAEKIHQNYISSTLTDINFNATKTFTSDYNKHSIYYDNEKEQILVITKTGIDSSHYAKTLINTKDIIECSLYEDDATITKTSRGSQLGGALVGGVLAGGVGAVVGGLSGNKTSTGATKTIELRLTLDNPLNPVLRFRFLDSYDPIKKDSYTYEKTMNEAIEWQSLIAVLIYRAEEKVD